MRKVNHINRLKFFQSAALAGAGFALTSSGISVTSGIENSSQQNIPVSKDGKRKLGKLEVSGIGLGCMSMVAGTYNPTPPKQEMIAHIRKAVERGVTFFDTAEVYGPYTSEELVGEALEPFKGKVKIVSKFGWNIQDNKRVGRIATPESIKKVVEGSLKRLRIEAKNLALASYLGDLLRVRSLPDGLTNIAGLTHWIAALSYLFSHPRVLRKTCHF